MKGYVLVSNVDMKFPARFLMSAKGFTLVELLVVIGVLGIIAAGLLATIDPLEQFRKGSDSNRKTATIELHNALTRYYAGHSVYPWATVANGGAACNAASVPSGTQVSSTGFVSCLTALQNDGELKPSFSTQTQIIQALYATNDTAATSNNSVAVCFDPESKAESRSQQTEYSQIGAAVTTCESDGGTTVCYWCAK